MMHYHTGLPLYVKLLTDDIVDRAVMTFAHLWSSPNPDSGI